MIEYKLKRDGFHIKKSTCDKNVVVQWRKQLTVKADIPFQQNFSQYSNQLSIPFKIYRENINYIILPRFFVKQELKTILNVETINTLVDSKYYGYSTTGVVYTKELRDKQKPIVNTLLQSIKTSGGGILSAPCGTGKTAMALKIMVELQKKTLIVVHNESLAEQWVERIRFFTNITNIGIIRGNKTNTQHDVVISMLQSICSKDYDKDIFKSFGFTIIDECHHIAARVFSRALPKIASEYMLGLSATPNRKDGLTNVFTNYIGPITQNIKFERDTNVVVHLYKLFSKNDKFKEVKSKTGYACIPQMITNITNCKIRTFWFLHLVKELVSCDRQILILTDRRDHVIEMVGWCLSHDINAGPMMGVTKKIDRELRSKSLECQVIIGTYSMVAEGFDCSKLDTLIFASPKKDIEQSVGRILRKTEYDNQPLIIDIVDQNRPFRNNSYARTKFYKSNKKPNYIIYEKKIKLDEYNIDENCSEFTDYLDVKYDNNNSNIEISSETYDDNNIPSECLI